MALEAGKKAPEFTAPIEGGEKISLSDFKGDWLILYFYPKDDTPGCTKEAKSFRDSLQEIKDSGAQVLGVSPDTVESHDKFHDKYDLNFHIAADPDKEICKMYDVYGEKKMFGKTSMGVKRSTYIIDPEGVIRYVYKSVKVKDHTQQVLDRLEKLKKES